MIKFKRFYAKLFSGIKPFLWYMVSVPLLSYFHGSGAMESVLAYFIIGMMLAMTLNVIVFLCTIVAYVFTGKCLEVNTDDSRADKNINSSSVSTNMLNDGIREMDRINPATGLLMIGGLDIEGNPYGTDFSHDDTFDHSMDDFFSYDIDDSYIAGIDDSFGTGSGSDDW